MTERIHTLHVIPSVSAKHGGPSYAVRAIARALKAVDVDVTIATTDDDGDDARLGVPIGERVDEDGAGVYYFRRDILPYKVSVGLARWLRSNVSKFDVVHVHALFSFSSTTAAHYAHHKGVPYMIRPLGVLNRYGLENRRPVLKKLTMPLIENRILRHSATIHYTSEAEKREASEVSAEIAMHRAAVIALPIEREIGEADELRRAFPQIQNKRVILFLSRIDPKKGIELLLDAFAKVSQQLSGVALVIAGKGEANYTAALRQRSKELKIDNNVIWAGHLEGALKAAAFAAADVFVLPSYSENFGIAAGEAMACGIPTIVTEGVAVSEEIRANEAGIVISTEAHEVASAIYRMLTDLELAGRLSANAKRLAAGRYSLEAIGAQLRNLYDRILRERK
jgi:glycosyltransferase involved in cell wall biosynthesis